MAEIVSLRLLIVDDDDQLREVLQRRFQQQGLDVTTAGTAEDALARAEQATFDVALLDLHLPDRSGIELLGLLKTKQPELEALMMTADGSMETAIQAMKSGAYDYVTKPFHLAELDILVQKAFEKVRLARQQEQMIQALTESEARFRNLLESAPDAILQIDADGKIVLLNRQAERMFGYARDELLGKAVEILVSESHEAHVAHRRRFFERPSVRPMGTGLNLVLRRKDGGTLPVDICIAHHRAAGQQYAIAAVRDITERRRMEEDLRVANEAAEHAYQRIRRDIQAAAKLQRALLPARLPLVPGIQFAWEYHPCEGLAGDGLNIFTLDDDHLGLYLLDVSGHGTAAALLSVSLARLLSPSFSPSTLLRVRQPDQEGYRIVPPAEVAHQLNQWLLANQSGEQFFTLLYGILEIRTQRLRFISAAHPGVVHVPAHAETVPLRVPGFPIGCVAEVEYEERSLQLQSGDRLFLYSDGFPDAANSAGEHFGAERLCQVIESVRGKPVEASARRLLREVLQWTDDDPRMTCRCWSLRWTNSPARLITAHDS